MRVAVRGSAASQSMAAVRAHHFAMYSDPQQFEAGRGAVDAALSDRNYNELRQLARLCLARRDPNATLQPTALVHEAYLKLVRGGAPPVHDGRHAVALLARAMRQVIVNHALARRTVKREFAGKRVALDDALDFYDSRSVDLVALDEALERLRGFDPRQAGIVDLRFFGALTTAQVAEQLGVSTRTVEREWRIARAWLRTEIGAS